MRLRKMIDNLNTIVFKLNCDFKMMNEDLKLIKHQTQANRNNYKQAQEQLTHHWEHSVFPELSKKREEVLIKRINVLENKLHKENIEQGKMIVELQKFIDFISVNRPKKEIGFTFDRYIIKAIEPVSDEEDEIYYQYFIEDNKGFKDENIMIMPEDRALEFIDSCISYKGKK